MEANSIPSEWLPRYSQKDYEGWKGDWELIRGFPYAISPSSKRKHQEVGRNFIGLMNEELKKTSGCDCAVYYELDWIIEQDTIVRPDVMIVCGTFEDDYLRFPPTLILEITSPATRLKDRNLKFHLYEQSGVRYYLMADPDNNSLEVFQLKDNRFTEKKDNEFLLSPNCTITPDLNKIFA